MSVDVDLHSHHDAFDPARRRVRVASAPHVVALSAETAEQMEALLPRTPRVTRVALVGDGPQDERADGSAGAPPRASSGRTRLAGGWRQLAPANLLALSFSSDGTEPDASAFEVRRGVDASSLDGEDAIVICGPVSRTNGAGEVTHDLGHTCSEVARAARLGQTIILASAGYVGSTRDLLVAPLEARGLTAGRDVHVAFVKLPGARARGDGAGFPVVGGATPECAAAAAAIVARLGPVQVVATPEEAEAHALARLHGSPRGAAIKRAIDVAVAGTALVVLAPTLAAVAGAILLDDGRPILFNQERMGVNGRPFRLRKFRTMVDGAEARLHEVAPLNTIRGPGFQLDDDPRLTRIGAFLRRSSLDELPQLWNVLRGEMSLVGPRPAPSVEVEAYEPWHRGRLAVKPGITGLAQIRARSYRDFDDKARLDLDYIARWSTPLDLEILLRTVPVVLKLTGR